MIALFISAVVAYVVFGLKRGFSWDQLGRFSEQGMSSSSTRVSGVSSSTSCPSLPSRVRAFQAA